MARDDAPEAALAAATSLETVAERCARLWRRSRRTRREPLAAALAAAVEEAAAVDHAAEARMRRVQAERRMGAAGARREGQREDTVDIFFDLADQAETRRPSRLG